MVNHIVKLEIIYIFWKSCFLDLKSKNRKSTINNNSLTNVSRADNQNQSKTFYNQKETNVLVIDINEPNKVIFSTFVNFYILRN